jgi:hypothetical protein
MRIKVGDKFRDYMGVPYIVKKYQHSNITFEVDNGNLNDEVYTKKEFISELAGNRFHIDNSEPQYLKEDMRAAFQAGLRYGKGGNKEHRTMDWDKFIEVYDNMKKD